MPGFVFHQLATMNCPHGGVAAIAVPAQQRVLVNGAPAATALDRIVVAGCGLTPVLCATVQWANVSGRVMFSGQPALLQAPGPGPGNGTCIGPPAPAPIPMVSTMQARVTGS